ncbi:hypothetical protein O4O04_14170 [Leptospira sp. GIMC2001]|nr:hypothetical protein [Leptospira sp. GIMC2001]WCL48442.1 hypothetical protein O4O04_14170 [Leptospira sp. GIMC2001]
MKHQADVRGLSSSELARVAIQNEITKKTNYDRITALRRIRSLASNMDISESES